VAKYDVAIIGSGPGGYVAAIRAGELGLKTVVVEKDPFLGGTCLHVGCIPTKVLLHHAEVYDHFKNGAELGFEVSGLKINWANVLARKDKIVKKHAKGIEFLFKKNKVEWVQGWGRYEGPGKISVEKDGKKTTIEASNILVAATHTHGVAAAPRRVRALEIYTNTLVLISKIGAANEKRRLKAS
jgi:dihydrolipoamide dehydrogenase